MLSAFSGAGEGCRFTLRALTLLAAAILTFSRRTFSIAVSPRATSTLVLVIASTAPAYKAARVTAGPLPGELTNTTGNSYSGISRRKNSTPSILGISMSKIPPIGRARKREKENPYFTSSRAADCGNVELPASSDGNPDLALGDLDCGAEFSYLDDYALVGPAKTYRGADGRPDLGDDSSG